MPSYGDYDKKMYVEAERGTNAKAGFWKHSR